MGYILQGLQRYGYGWKQSYPEDGSVSGLDAGRANAKLYLRSAHWTYFLKISGCKNSGKFYDCDFSPDKNKRRKNTPMPSMKTRPIKLMRP